MAFLRYADARVIHPRVSKTQWQNIRTASQKDVGSAEGELATDLVTRAEEFLGQKFGPKQYLLTHASIVASVDTFSPSGVKTGSVLEEGFRVNRKYSDFRVTPETNKFINSNFDAWSRGVLLKSYKTFIGGQNFLEHVQVESLSKGRIIDAVARDIGDSLYIDILIATDRKHTELVKAIESGKMGTLSMGCTTDFTICTKCGHVAADETELCTHVKYSKGNTFFDEQGRKQIVAELCGHSTLDPHGGVQFIEASWVATPAFTGAVMRNVIEPTETVAQKAAKILATPPAQWTEGNMAKAAALEEGTALIPRTFSAGEQGDIFLAGWLDEGGGDAAGEAPADGATEAPPAPPASPFKDVEDEAYKVLMEKLKKRVQKDIQTPEEKEPHTPTESTNENMNKLAAFKLYEAGLGALCKTASSDIALVEGVAIFNQHLGIQLPVELYRAALAVGNPAMHGSKVSYKTACQKALHREPTEREAKVLLKLGQLLFRRESSGGCVIGTRHKGEKQC